MAANSPSPIILPRVDGLFTIVKWTMIADSTGLLVSLPGRVLESITGVGNFATTGKILVEGSIDEVTFGPVVAFASGTPSVVGNAQLDESGEIRYPVGGTLAYRPRVTNNGNGDAIAVTVFAYFRPRT